jgi:hypothetical protein
MFVNRPEVTSGWGGGGRGSCQARGLDTTDVLFFADGVAEWHSHCPSWGLDTLPGGRSGAGKR